MARYEIAWRCMNVESVLNAAQMDRLCPWTYHARIMRLIVAKPKLLALNPPVKRTLLTLY